MKIAFVGNYQYSCGSSNALLGYVRAGKLLGHDIRVSEYGYIDNVIRQKVPVAGKSWGADLLVIVYESYPFLSDKDIEEIKKYIPRERIIIIDPDCKYLKPITSKDDTNHPDENSYKYWTQLYESLSDKILQPRLNKIKEKNVYKFVYFGIDSNDKLKNVKKDFDLLYVGNNWYRWDDIRNLVNALRPIRNKLKKFAVMGNYWNKDTMKGYEKATFSDLNFLGDNNIKIIKPAPYGKVETSMSRGLINPIYVRPILNKLKLVTPRMFETFAADTVVVIPGYFSHAVDLYGIDIEQLILPNHPNNFILNIITNYEKYLKLCKKIRNKMILQNSYKVRLKELINII